MAWSVLVATAEAFEAPQRVVVAFDGSPGARRALARLAQHPLVMGAFGRSRLRQLLLGSITSSRRRLSDVPVLILR